MRDIDKVRKVLTEVYGWNKQRLLDDADLISDTMEARNIALNMRNVSHRRELLLFREWQKQNWKDVYLYSSEFMVDTYLSKKL